MTAMHPPDGGFSYLYIKELDYSGVLYTNNRMIFFDNCFGFLFVYKRSWNWFFYFCFIYF